MAKIVKRMLNFVMLKSFRTFHYLSKLYSKLFLNPRGVSLALEAEKILKNTKVFRKNLKRQVL